MWIPRSLLLLSLSSLISLASAASKVTSPTFGDKIVAGQPTVVKWSTDAPGSVSLTICYNGGPNAVCNPFAKDLDNTGSYTWTPDTSLPNRSDYFILLITSNVKDYPSSGLFAITSGTSSSATTSNPATTSSSSTGTSGSITSGSSTATNSPSTDSGSSSNGGIIGGAIAAVVVVIIIAIAGFIWMRKRNQKKLAEARRGHGDEDDVETGEKKSIALNGAAAGKKSDKNSDKNSDKKEAFAPKEGYSEASSIPLAELPAIQQEAVEMAAIPSSPSGGRKFFAMELDSREIPRPGSAVKPDVDPTSNPTSPAAKPSMDRAEFRGASIDGTTVNSETERPKTAGSIEQIKESSRENLTEQSEPQSGPRTPPQEPAPLEEERAGPSIRDSTPQIGSIPKLGGFDFDTAKF